MIINKLEKKHAAIIAIALIAFIAVIIALVIFTVNQPSNENYSEHTGSGEEVFEKSAIFANRYQLNQLYGKEQAATILSQIEEIIFSDEAIATAPHENESETPYYYNVILIETSFKKYSSSPETYTFGIEISDGRFYQAYTRRDTEYDAEADVRTIRLSTILVSDQGKYFRTDATNSSLLENLEAWRQKF